ncbi:MAG: XRE family transcriptional regulator [Syntrophorhabdaceae bacterium]|nr:XRE family transcriptional regulator [Syntrophorhabdaceae bacterium]
MQEFTRDENLDDILSKIEQESGELSAEAAEEGAVPVGRNIKAFREKMGLTPQQFADKLGLSSALLTSIENRMLSPSLGMLVHIASVFGTTVSSFIGGQPERDYCVVRKEDHANVSRVGLKDGEKTYMYQSLGSGKAGRKMEPFLLKLQPTPESKITRSVHAGEEFIYVFSGEVEVLLDNNRELLRAGDSIYFSSTTPHHVHSAKEDEEASILAVLHAGN